VAAAVLVAAAVPIGRVLVQGVSRGGDVTELARGIVAFAPGLVGYGLLALLSRALYARHDARTPAVCTVIGWLVVVVADLVLSAVLPAGSRVLALALGNTIGMTVAAVLLLGGLLRRAGGAALRGVPRMTAVALVAAAVAGAAGRWLASEVSGGGAVAALGQCVVVGVVTLLIAAAALSVLARDDVRRLLRMRRG
jgi:putative peptidoglycan lipid II flippase